MAQRPSDETGPNWRRRKAARPAEITAAALEVFADHGFAAAKLEEIARRAGVVKGSIYLYFANKEELFRAVVRSAFSPSIVDISAMADAFDRPLAEFAPAMLAFAASVLSRPVTSRFARMVIAEAGNFPDLAGIWRDEVIAPMLQAVTRAIERAQARGEAREGDARLYAFSLVGPLVTAMLFREVFAQSSSDAPDLTVLAGQHGRALLGGLLAAPTA